MNKVELHNAYVWDCEACGRENFCRTVIVEMTPEDVEEMFSRHGGDRQDWETGHWETRPDLVTCIHCGAEFETEDWEAPPRGW